MCKMSHKWGRNEDMQKVGMCGHAFFAWVVCVSLRAYTHTVCAWLMYRGPSSWETMRKDAVEWKAQKLIIDAYIIINSSWKHKESNALLKSHDNSQTPIFHKIFFTPTSCFFFFYCCELLSYICGKTSKKLWIYFFKKIVKKHFYCTFYCTEKTICTIWDRFINPSFRTVRRTLVLLCRVINPNIVVFIYHVV